MRLSKRAQAVSISETLRLSMQVARLRQAGHPIISFLEGEPDLPMPSSISQAISRALKKGDTRYSPSSGLSELKKALAQKIKAENKIVVSEDQILITNGAKQAIYETLQVLCDPGDEVIVLAPYWVTFPDSIRLAGARPKFVFLKDGQIDITAIGRAVNRRTKAIIVNSPHNPTGAVFGEGELKELIRIAAKHNFYVISDEAYRQFVYDGRQPISPAHLSSSAAKHTITIRTFSKSFSMAGLRLGYLVAPPEIVAAAARIHGHMTGNVCNLIQRGGIAAVASSPAYMRQRRTIYEQRRDLAFDLVSPLFSCAKPQGGLFLWADARPYLGPRFRDSAALSEFFLNKAHVATVPGSACGLEGWMRFSFSCSEDNIRQGYKQIKEALWH